MNSVQSLGKHDYQTRLHIFIFQWNEIWEVKGKNTEIEIITQLAKTYTQGKYYLWGHSSWEPG